MPRPSKAIYRDDDDRPRRNADPDGPPVLLIALGGIGVVVVLAGLATVAWFLLARPPAPPPAAPPVAQSAPAAPQGRKPPTGWTDVKDADGGYQVFLPGAVAKGQPQLAGPVPAGVQMTLYAGTGDKVTATARSIKPAAAIPPKTTPDEMLGWLPHWNIGTDKTSELEAKTPVTLGGKSGLLVKVKEKRKDYSKLFAKGGGGQGVEAKGNDPQELKDALDLLKEYQQATAEAQQQTLKKLQDEENSRPVRHEVYLVTSNGQRVIVIHLKQQGDYPDEGTLATVTNSFEFL